MISYLSLLSYATALWLHSEVFDLKNNMPRLQRLLLAAIGLNMSSSPAFHWLLRPGHADRGGMFFIAAPILLITSWALWRRKAIDLNTLLLGLLPPSTWPPPRWRCSRSTASFPFITPSIPPGSTR
jgi:hypothetical protein